MSKEQLLHIFDESTCLTRRQMKDYVNGLMTNEESHAVEVHLNACPMCNDAIDGLFEQQEGRAVDMLTTLDGDFLKDHLGMHNPKVHLNSMANAQAEHLHTHTRKQKNKSQVHPFWRNTSIAAMLLLAIGLLWFLKFGRDNVKHNKLIAGQTMPAEKLPENPPTTVIANNTETAPSTTQTDKTPIVEPALTPATSISPKPAPALIAANVPKEPAAKEMQPAKDEKEKKAVQEEVVGTQYKAPLIDKYEGPSSTPADKVEKMPARSTEGLATTAPAVYSGNNSKSLNISGARNSDNVAYTVEGVATRSAKEVSQENLAKGSDLFEKGKYEPALRVYKRELDSDDKSVRQKAILMSAKCYIQLDNTAKAKELLQTIIDEGGPEKRAANKLLKELNK